jgi:hypothetical protein
MIPSLIDDVGSSTDSLCLPFVRQLGVSGSSISVSSDLARQATVCASDSHAARIDALQFELGEGPRWDVVASRAAIICPDLAVTERSRWPIFLPAVSELGVGALFCFPMLMGAALVGVVDLYCTTPREVDQEFLSRASVLAGRAASGAVQKALHSAESPDSHESVLAPALRREVHQATGLILSQLDISATEAFSRLQGYAFAAGKSIDEIAHLVVERTLRFDDIPENI